ncbi:MAG TPA: pyridoxamine 5'-phosphate oxidase [Oxalobacteraceae bacterium]|nr:pyridoxamine 5'-phosphate oxidase [Oxalobacteraceae bacterium]
MQITSSSAIHLLHQASAGVLATQSLQLAGYPFATALPFALDERHCLLFLISALAEHTKNLLADARASFLVAEPGTPNVLKGARLSILGEARPFEAQDELVARYLRYQPDAKLYLELGDFSFFRLEPLRARYIAGFGEMGWVEQADWQNAAILPLADEVEVYRAVTPALPNGMRILGIDAYGFDVEHAGRRERHQFSNGPLPLENLAEVISRFLNSL